MILGAMLVGSTTRGNALAAKAGRLSQVKMRYVRRKLRD
jgi:hypothetical protein